MPRATKTPPATEEVRAAEEVPSGTDAEQLNRLFVQAVLADWKKHGAAAIRKVGNDRPHDYLKLVTSLLAKDPDAKSDAADAFSDDELAAELAAILARLAAAGAGDCAGAGAPP